MSMLNSFWKEVHQVDKLVQTFDSEILPRECYRFIRLPLPHWGHEVWESQLPLLTVVLSEQEIRQIHCFHSNVYMLAERHAALSSTQRRKYEIGYNQAGKWGTGDGPTLKGVDQTMPGPWQECEQIVHRLLETGNPLESKLTSHHVSN